MNFNDLVSGVSQGVQAVQTLSGGSPAPVAPSLQSGSGVLGPSGSGVSGQVLYTGGGLVILYLILRFLNLLPRWARII